MSNPFKKDEKLIREIIEYVRDSEGDVLSFSVVQDIIDIIRDFDEREIGGNK